MLRRLFLLNIALMLSVMAFSKPARPGILYLTQPDGSGFSAVFSGDESMRLKRTLEGNAIVQESDGWWCYAVFDPDGTRYSTGHRVGSDVPYDILLQSREIPYDVLAENASERRAPVRDVERRDRDMLSRIRKRTMTRNASEGTSVKYGIVILAQFKDVKEHFSFDKKDFDNMLMQEGYSSHGATGCAKEYFDAQFDGKYEFCFDVTEIVTLDKDMAFYGRNDSDGQDINPHLMVMEACEKLDSEVDFSRYDQDGDGEVDNVFVFFAGKDEAEGASEDCIWSHAWYIKDGAGKNLILDGVRINRYACASELQILRSNRTTLTGIGTFCHEYSHTFGLPDLYDTDYPIGGLAAGTWGSITLMDGGNYNNNGNTPPNYSAVERDFLGITEPQVIEASGSYSLGPVSEGLYYRIDSGNDGEYFLLECRTASGWDSDIGGSGLLVYHIDRSFNPAGYSDVYKENVTAAQRWGDCNEVNALASHQCADLVEADGRRDSFDNMYDGNYQNYLSSLAGLFFPYGGATSLIPDASPGFRCWGEAGVDKAVTDIVFDGKKVTFNLSGYSEDSLPVPVDLECDVFQDASIVTFSSSFLYDGTARIVCSLAGKVVHTADVKPYGHGRWAYVIEGLEPSSSYTVNVNFVSEDYIGEKVKQSFMTKRRQSSSYPYIYLSNVERLSDGRFPSEVALPLRLFNAGDAEEIRWTFNGEPIEVGDDCYYRPVRSGTLRAHIFREDGTEEIIAKVISIGREL